MLVDQRAGAEPGQPERFGQRVRHSGGQGVREHLTGGRGGLKPPVPQPQMRNRFSNGVAPMIGEASGVTSTTPAQPRIMCALAKIGNSSSAAAICSATTCDEPR